MSRTKLNHVIRFHSVSIFTLLALVLVACGASATATPEPTATPGPSPTADAASPAPQTEQFVPLMPSREHVPVGESVSYSTTPPTSGPHWPQWARCGIYREEVPDELVVHNMEHGNIVVSYHLTDEAEAARLEQAVRAIELFSEWGILRPYPRISEGSVAVTT